MNANEKMNPTPSKCIVRSGAWTILLAAPAITVAAIALVSNRVRVQQAANRTAYTIRRAGKSFSRNIKQRAAHVDRAVEKISEAVREEFKEVRSAVS